MYFLIGFTIFIGELLTLLVIALVLGFYCSMLKTFFMLGWDLYNKWAKE